MGQAVVAQAFNPSTQEAELGGSVGVHGQHGLQSEFYPLPKKKVKERGEGEEEEKVRRGDCHTVSEAAPTLPLLP